jgi:hypothetical protein
LGGSDGEKLRETYHDIIVFELEWLGLDSFWAESLAVDESAIRTFDVFDVYLSTRPSVFPPTNRE